MRSREPGDILREIRAMAEDLGQVQLMEICGTHTMAIAKAGLKSLLPQNIRLISGPGCPVCVTPAGAVDELLRISGIPGVIMASYGDLLRVPGSRRGDSLLKRRAQGADVRMVYSPMDALAMAEANPGRQVVFAGVGFETTAPGTAACLMEARERQIDNFSVLSLLKTTEPAIRALAGAPGAGSGEAEGPQDAGADACRIDGRRASAGRDGIQTCARTDGGSRARIDGFLCPGHVAVITGSEAFRFLPKEYGLPGVVSGFEPEDLLASVYLLVKMLHLGRPKLVNEYSRLVRPEGNLAARKAVEQVFAPSDSLWRGLGEIAGSGLAVREEFAAWDGARRFGFAPDPKAEAAGCRCGDVIRGLLAPEGCPLFGKSCRPEDPAGPCMVSGEGACAAAYRYRE